MPRRVKGGAATKWGAVSLDQGIKAPKRVGGGTKRKV